GPPVPAGPRSRARAASTAFSALPPPFPVFPAAALTRTGNFPSFPHRMPARQSRDAPLVIDL
ncbi:hypothetical protein, partial [Burkholderia cepacia]|uniref:hypothetical protein n=1 Tax=Burkholderia cepacia TaxID=292 RepID=UPI001C724006